MNSRAPISVGALRVRSGRKACRGFTLLEMCIVLVIIGLLIGALMPSMQTALTEQAVRTDSHQLAVMVRTAMFQSNEQHRAYVIDFTSTSMKLHPATNGDSATDSTLFSDNTTGSAANSNLEDVEMECQLNPPNKLQVPDANKAHVWTSMPASSWFFQPGNLCPAQTVRFARGNSWVELSFNALTGDVENEGAYFP